MEITELLQLTIDKQASDLHLIAGYYPTIRISGELHQLTAFPLLTKELAESLIFSILTSEQKENTLANRESDLGYEFHDFRFRINVYYSMGKLSASFRLIPNVIKTIEELHLPQFLHTCSELKQGLILLTGPTGEGKSTTLASIINEINTKYARHIITVEDPVEFIYPKKKSIISQRQLQDDTLAWTMALRSALREDPDVILVGEMRDYDTIQLVLTAAETGHLVFSTLHTNSTPESIDRIIDTFPSNQQSQVRNQLSSVLKMVITQRLVPRIDESGLIPAFEILLNTNPVSENIREGKTYLLNNILETQEKEGFILLEKYLLTMYRNGVISRETALTYAIRPKEMEKFIK
jgi:twitching motility protein PilT